MEKNKPISEVFNEDCMVGMARYPDNFFDLAIVDPPYGIGWDGEVPSMVREGTKVKEYGWRRKSSGYARKDWDKEPPVPEYFTELFRVSKEQIIWGGNLFDLPPSKGFIFWDKQTGEDWSLGDGELAWASVTGAVRKFTYRWAGFLKGANGNVREERIHPTQKPLALYKWLLVKYANLNDKILDTHMGSQSSRIAAFNMGFDYYGWEIDKEYFEKGNKRFAEQTAQIKLF